MQTRKKKIGEAENDLLPMLTSLSTMRDLYKEYWELRDGLEPGLITQNEKLWHSEDQSAYWTTRNPIKAKGRLSWWRVMKNLRSDDVFDRRSSPSIFIM